MFSNFIKFFTFCLLVAMLFVQTSCKKSSNFQDQTLPSITSLSPESGFAGSPVTIRGINLKNVVAVQFGTKPAADFLPANNTDTEITVNVPDSTGLGDLYVQVYYADGSGYSAYKFTVLLTPPVPAITTVAPTSGLPGDVVTVTGNEFSLVSSVKVGGLTALFVPTLDTNHVMKVTIPADAAGGLQYITLTNPNGKDSLQFTVLLTPVITLIPASPVNVGDQVTIEGLRFNGATEVKVGTITVSSFTVLTDTTIQFTVPAGALTSPITVTTPNGTTTSAGSLVVQVAGLALPFYEDVVNTTNWNGWIGGGWGGAADYANTTPTESGTNSIKIDYAGGWGSPVQLGGATITLATYTTFKISIYGGPGTTGKKIKIVFNSAGGFEQLLGTEGQWNDYVIPISNISSDAVLGELWLQEFTGTDYTVYIDNMGLN
ncbi:MAG: IPT/TIG domain-containing protein [Ferruginibacter sp.]